MCVKIDYQCGQDPIPVDRAGEHRADYGEGENHPCIGEKKKSNKGPELGRTDLRNKPLRSSVASVARDFGQASGHFLSPFNRKKLSGTPMLVLRFRKTMVLSNNPSVRSRFQTRPTRKREKERGPLEGGL